MREESAHRQQAETSGTPFFSSGRERRLWIWTLVVLTAIFSTLALTNTLAGLLIDSGWFGGTFFFGFLLIWVAILTQGLKVRPRGLEIGIAIGIAAVYLMVFARLGIPERTHLFEYGVVAIFVYEALTERASQGKRVPVPALLAILTATFIGVFDECIQWFLPNRVFDPVDMGFNFIAVVMGVGGSAAIGWARRMTIGGGP